MLVPISRILYRQRPAIAHICRRHAFICHASYLADQAALLDVLHFAFAVRSTTSSALHADKDLAVSLQRLLFGLILCPTGKIRLNQGCLAHFEFGVSVRTSQIALDGRYPLPCCPCRKATRSACSDFPLRQSIRKPIAQARIRYKHDNYSTKNLNSKCLFTLMGLLRLELEVAAE